MEHSFPVWLCVAVAGLILSFGFPSAFDGLGQTLGAVVALFAVLFFGARDQPAARRRRPGR